MQNAPEIKRGMVVVAHADDAEFGCSGTVAKWCSEGWEVVYVLCTDGSKGSSDRQMTQENLSKIRKQEQINAGKVLGLKDITFLNYPDSFLEPTLELRREIARQIRIHQPDILITTNPTRNLDSGWGLGHPDHIATGEAAMSAVFPTARDHMTFPEMIDEGLEPHKVAEVWVIGSPNPNFWVDVTDHIETSIESLSQHVSQIGDRNIKEVTTHMKDRRRKTATGRGIKYAEEFQQIVLDPRLQSK